ncbi:acyl-CoA dehydrogenase [Paraphoma chrysanthemicola]|uniref:Acyl-CoA dehydrogenase n=1 Tax=Paraphoma chrysanthemicola TaxID=798071 RepID=A0A8K0W0I4_9PLEO|nr:acyl-CoA dehydrogenase [Paraphoma chrysanthemicola]
MSSSLGVSPWYHGSKIPYAEPPWSRGSPSPYLKDSHRKLRDAMRSWVESNVLPFTTSWEEDGEMPKEIYQRAAEDGILMPMGGGSSIPKEWAGKFPIIGGIAPEEWDGFHDFIIHSELNRIGGIGVQNGLIGGVTLCMPAVRRFGSEKLRTRIANDVLSGSKRICLAITEPEAGSDVAQICTEAVLTPDGRHYKVSGQKKWITSGMYADYFLTLTKTSADGMTMLVVPKSEGLTVRHMKMQGSGSAGTAFVDYDDVMVPVENVLGEVGKGLKCIMSNFNHERLFISFQSLSCARVCLEDCISHGLIRETFGKKLIDHPIIRFKLANMARETEALQAWIESLVFQLSAMSEPDAELLLAGQIAQLKAHSGIVLQNVVRDAIQVLGGIGLTRGGRGERVERIWRDVKAISVPGGSEEILLELSIKRAIRAQKILEGKIQGAKL